MSLSISPHTKAQQSAQFPVCFFPPNASPANGAMPTQISASPVTPSGSRLGIPGFSHSLMNPLQSVIGMMQQLMASFERVVSMVSSLVSGLFGGVQASGAGQSPAVAPIGIANASTPIAEASTLAEATPAEQKPSKWESILNIGSTILSALGIFTGGGAGGLLGSLGALFKGGAGKIGDILKKGLSLFS